MWLKCQRCGHTWDFTGVDEYRATCPNCTTTVRFGTGRRLYEESIAMGEA